MSCHQCGESFPIDKRASCACFRDRDREASVRRSATPCSASYGPLGKRGPIEMHVGMVRLAVHAQCEPDGRWAARVPDLTEHCEMGSTREDAIERAIKAVSVVSPQNAIALASPPQRLASKKDVPGG